MHLATPSPTPNLAGRVIAERADGADLAFPGTLMTPGAPRVDGVKVTTPTMVPAGTEFDAAVRSAQELSAKVQVTGAELWSEHAAGSRADGSTGNQAVGIIQAADGQLLLSPLVGVSGDPVFIRSKAVDDAYFADRGRHLTPPVFQRSDEALLALVGADDVVDLRSEVVTPYPFQ